MASNGRIRSAFPVANGSKDLTPDSAPVSTAGSECGQVEFTREDVEALLNERIKYKSKFNYKVSSFVCTLTEYFFLFFSFRCLVL